MFDRLDGLFRLLDGLFRLVGFGRSAGRAATWKPDEARVRRDALDAQRRLDDLERRQVARDAGPPIATGSDGPSSSTELRGS